MTLVALIGSCQIGLGKSPPTFSRQYEFNFSGSFGLGLSGIFLPCSLLAKHIMYLLTIH